MEKTFRGELDRMRDLLRARVPFGLARFGHAEMEILKGKLMRADRDVSGGHEYRFAPADTDHAQSRQMLWDSFIYRHPRYLVGINCPHCNIPDADFEWMRHNSGQPEDRLTFATIYFYSNYQPYLAEVLPLYNNYKTVLVCHEAGGVENLPFQPVDVFRNEYNAWRKNISLVEDLERYIAKTQIRGGLFLFCAGALGCILAHRLHAFCPENTYLDIGSSLDPYLFTGILARNRRYLKQDPETQASESCCWKPRSLEVSASPSE
jgi:hypothetical protein